MGVTGKERIWVLADDRPGNVSQALGVAVALGEPYAVKLIRYNALAELPNTLRGASLLGVKQEELKLEAPWPEVVIAAGRRLAPVARYIKKASGGRTRLVHLMWPGMPVKGFDLISIPEHDRRRHAPVLLRSLGAPNGITPQRLKEEAEKWQQNFAYLPDPKIALVVGGDTRHGKFSEENAEEFVRRVNRLVAEKNCSLLVTTSRRTPEHLVNMLRHDLRVPFYLHDFRRQEDNPYLGMLGLSEAIIVTGDSISMCSEACSTGKPVYIYAPKSMTPPKYRHLHETLYSRGYAKPLEGEYSHWAYEPLNEAGQVASYIREHLL